MEWGPLRFAPGRSAKLTGNLVGNFYAILLEAMRVLDERSQGEEDDDRGGKGAGGAF